MVLPSIVAAAMREAFGERPSLLALLSMAGLQAEASFNAVQTLREIWWRLSLWACRKLSYARAGRRALNTLNTLNG